MRNNHHTHNTLIWLLCLSAGRETPMTRQYLFTTTWCQTTKEAADTLRFQKAGDKQKSTHLC